MCTLKIKLLTETNKSTRYMTNGEAWMDRVS